MNVKNHMDILYPLLFRELYSNPDYSLNYKGIFTVNSPWASEVCRARIWASVAKTGCLPIVYIPNKVRVEAPRGATKNHTPNM